jgi:hypothetical protein
MIKPTFALLAVVLLAGCGGHQLASCSGPTFALAGPGGAVTASPAVAPARPTVLPAPKVKLETDPADQFVPHGGSMIYQKAEIR